MAGAVITVTDTGKNTNSRTITNGTGFFVVPQLAPGTYRITAEQVRACVAYAQDRLNEEKVFAVAK